MQEHVLILVKPDGMVKALAGQVLTRFLKANLKLFAAKTVTVSEELAKQHYAPIRNEPHFNRAVDFLSGKFHNNDKLLAFVFSGENAVKKARDVAGETNPEKAHPLSIRGSLGRITTSGTYENVVHVSATPKEAEQEIKLWFDPRDVDEEIFPIKNIRVENYLLKTWA